MISVDIRFIKIQIFDLNKNYFRRHVYCEGHPGTFLEDKISKYMRNETVLIRNILVVSTRPFNVKYIRLFTLLRKYFSVAILVDRRK